jgi:hypothetical protein
LTVTVAQISCTAQAHNDFGDWRPGGYE